MADASFNYGTTETWGALAATRETSTTPTWHSLPPAARRRASAAVRLSRRPASVRPAALVKRPPTARPRSVTDPNTARLLDQYTTVVHKIASSFQRRLPRSVLREDLVAAGMIGLWDAIRRHGEHPNEGFAWYVRVRVRGAILDELRAQDWLSRRVRKAAAEGAPPRVVRFEDVSEADQSRCLGTHADTGAELEQRANREALTRAVEALPERERLIVSEHYFHEVKFTALGARLGVSEPRISQLHSRAMRHLREIVAREDPEALSA